jgi:hypothetical protein
VIVRVLASKCAGETALRGARKITTELRGNQLSPVYHGDNRVRTERVSHLEGRVGLRRQTVRSASSLSISGEAAFPSPVIPRVVVGRILDSIRGRVSVNELGQSTGREHYGKGIAIASRRHDTSQPQLQGQHGKT